MADTSDTSRNPSGHSSANAPAGRSDSPADAPSANPSSGPATSQPASKGGRPPSTVFLIPCFLDEQSLAPLPAYILDAVKQCQAFFVENERSARRYLKLLWKEMVIDNYQWYPIGKAEEEVKAAFRQTLKEGKTIGIISEAGCPGVADPGQILTEAAHQAGATVKPLVGPSSILLALMASGLNGQQFRFNGYLPVDNTARAKALKDLESESQRLHCTQIFIETPYRNDQLLAAILATCRPTTRLCIAANLTGPAEYIRTLPISEWRKLAPPNPRTAAPDPSSLPSLHKQPTIFCLLA
ncbi:MAG TPA: SAM-dependent methyltransferase [Puia sp.]|nr:SAM-dependent methyltransferase [Puia sp.]